MNTQNSNAGWSQESSWEAISRPAPIGTVNVPADPYAIMNAVRLEDQVRQMAEWEASINSRDAELHAWEDAGGTADDFFNSRIRERNEWSRLGMNPVAG